MRKFLETSVKKLFNVNSNEVSTASSRGNEEIVYKTGELLTIRPNSIKTEKFDKIRLTTSLRENLLNNIKKIKDEHLQFVKCESGESQIFLKCDTHPLIQAIHTAYAYHLPLVLTPDMIWYCIASSTAKYIRENSEDLRNKFVDFEGKKSLHIRRDDFVLGSPVNPWHETIQEFSDQITENSKDGIADLFTANFSTTTAVSKVSSQIVLMDAMQDYFKYCISTMCGVPEIRLGGNKDDWLAVKSKANKIGELLPRFVGWMKNLNEILQNFIDVYDGKAQADFWNDIYKRKSFNMFVA